MFKFKIFTISNIPVKLDISAIILFAIYTAQYSALGAFLFIAVFGSVLFHEFAHILVARRLGILTQEVQLSFLGGAAIMEDMAADPKKEMTISLAGPVASLFLAGLLSPLMLFAQPAFPVLFKFIAYGVLINIVLAVFNMLPAFPLDGGRVLRAFLSSRLGHIQATKYATIISCVLFSGLLGIALFYASYVNAIFFGVLLLLSIATAIQENAKTL